MKKKIAALLTAALVLTMSASTVFAAASVSVNDKATTNATGSGTTGVIVSSSLSNSITVDDAKEEAVKQIKVVAPKAESTEVLAVTELGGTPPADGKVTLYVTGIKAGDKVFALHYNGTAWERLTASAKADGVVVIEGLTSFSPVAIVRYTVPTSSGSGNGNGSGSGTGSGSGSGSGSNYNVETQSSPKTGVVPFAAMAAGICLAGAAVCGKKVKFN